eukprot:6454879-Pyramimonas_sp.AAC.1
MCIRDRNGPPSIIEFAATLWFQTYPCSERPNPHCRHVRERERAELLVRDRDAGEGGGQRGWGSPEAG